MGQPWGEPMNHAAALFDSAIRFNSLLGMPAMTGKPVDGRPEQKSFLKALDSALDAGFDDAAVMSPLTAALGGEEKARDFLKAHVKAHTRVINGKVVYVKEHDTKETKQVVDRHSHPSDLASHAASLTHGIFAPVKNSNHPVVAAAEASAKADGGVVEDHKAAGEAHAKAAAWHQKMIDGNKGAFEAENKELKRRKAHHHDLAAAHFARTYDDASAAHHEQAAKTIRSGAPIAADNNEKPSSYALQKEAFTRAAEKAEEATKAAHGYLASKGIPQFPTSRNDKTMDDLTPDEHRIAADLERKASNAHHEAMSSHPSFERYRDALPETQKVISEHGSRAFHHGRAADYHEKAAQGQNKKG